jgi:hypothetical protein
MTLLSSLTCLDFCSQSLGNFFMKVFFTNLNAFNTLTTAGVSTLAQTELFRNRIFLANVYAKSSLCENFDTRTVLKTCACVYIEGTEKTFEDFSRKFLSAETIYNKSSNVLNRAEEQLRFLNSSLSEYTRKINDLKSVHNSSESHNVHVQNLAMQARTYAEQYRKTSKDADDLVNNYMRDAEHAFRSLNEILNYYMKLNASPNDDYDFDVITKRIQSLTDNARQLKTTIKTNLTEIDLHLKKVMDFQLPDHLNDNPDYDVRFKEYLDKLNEDVDELNGKQRDLDARLANEHEKQFKSELHKAHKSLDAAKLKQTDLENLSNEIKRMNEKSDKSVEDLDAALKNASNILNVLENFDENIAAGKQRHLEAEKLRPETNENLDKSNQYLTEIQYNLKTYEIKFIEKSKVVSGFYLRGRIDFFCSHFVNESRYRPI